MPLAHPLDHLDRQQRVAAEFEEVVVAPDPFQLSTSAQMRGQRGFHLAHRGFIAARSIGIASGAGNALRSSLPLGVSGNSPVVT